MRERRLFWLLLTPSISSSLLVLSAPGATMMRAGWLYITHSPAFYDYFFGPYGIKTLLLRMPDTSVLLRTWLFGSNATYYIVLVVTALIAGLTIFTVLQGIRHLISSSSSEWNLLQSRSKQAQSEIHDLFARLALRVASCIGWCVYIVLFATVLMPFALLLLQIGIDTVTKDPLGGLFNSGACFLALLIFAHVHIVFIRLLLLRPRLFGIRDIELAEL